MARFHAKNTMLTPLPSYFFLLLHQLLALVDIGNGMEEASELNGVVKSVFSQAKAVLLKGGLQKLQFKHLASKLYLVFSAGGVVNIGFLNLAQVDVHLARLLAHGLGGSIGRFAVLHIFQNFVNGAYVVAEGRNIVQNFLAGRGDFGLGRCNYSGGSKAEQGGVNIHALKGKGGLGLNQVRGVVIQHFQLL